jgi:hypothetical protein
MKIKSLSVMLFVALCFTNCKKDWTCECTTTITRTYVPEAPYYKNSVTTNSSSIVYQKVRKSDVKVLCADAEKTYTSTFDNNGTSINVTQTDKSGCEIK